MERTINAKLRRFVWSCIAVGTLLRLALSFVSFGSNDALIWEYIAARVEQSGLTQAYRTETVINHPPIPVLWARLSLALGGQPPEGAAAGTVLIAESWPRPWFSFVMKLPAIAADALTVVLLARIWIDSRDDRHARLAVLTMALSPVVIIISDYHCNTDSVYVCLSLLTAYLVTHRSQFFLAGLALGPAINVKLIPFCSFPSSSRCAATGVRRDISSEGLRSRQSRSCPCWPPPKRSTRTWSPTSRPLDGGGVLSPRLL